MRMSVICINIKNQANLTSMIDLTVMSF